MDGETFRADVESTKETELSRLGSQKLLLALTDADLSADSVLSVAAASEHAATRTFTKWAQHEPDERVKRAFSEVAATEETHHDRVRERMPDSKLAAPSGAVHDYLRDLDDTVERVAAGLVGRGLVSVRLHTQVIGFFINEADERSADLFRELKADTEATLERGLDLLDDCCEDDGDWERAREAAARAIDLAYEEYADALSGLGVDPKPVC